MSLRSNITSKTATATDAPSGTPGGVIIVSSPEKAEVDEIKLSVVKTPLVDWSIKESNVRSDIKTLLHLISWTQRIERKREWKKKAIDVNFKNPAPFAG